MSKQIAIETERRPVAEWLPKENGEVYLTRPGRPEFVLGAWDEGDDEQRPFAARQDPWPRSESSLA